MNALAPIISGLPVANPVPLLEEKPAISVVGLGYVGAVSTACLASLGHDVIGVDIDPTKIAYIANGQSPIHEKGLSELLSEGVRQGRITTTRELYSAVRDTDVTFVSVGTPTAADGGCDYSHIREAARSMADGLALKDNFHVFVMRCSIPPGTTMQVMKTIIENRSGKKLGEDFGVAFNPEFLREGVAIADFHAPPKTVIGATCERTGDMVRKIYAPIDDSPIITSIETAEMVKYVDNVWHAAKVCFANEVGRLCKSQGVDSHGVMDIFCQDTKLNLSPYYLKPGFAYGGSCLPKEVRAVAHIAQKAGISLPMIENLDTSNKAHVAATIQMVRETGAKRVGVLGLSFKPGTDDLRESPILDVIAQLREEGIEVVAHDPVIKETTNIEAQLSYVKHGNPGLVKLASELKNLLVESPGDAVDQADAVIVTQKYPFYGVLARLAAESLNKPVIDVVRAFEDVPTAPAYHGIGW